MKNQINHDNFFSLHFFTLLFTIYTSGHSPIVDLLICGGAELDMVDCDGKTALHLACAENHYEVVVQLLRYCILY